MKRIATLTAACLMALTACSTIEAEPPGVIGDWVMTGGTLDGAPFPLIDGHRVTISFSEDGSVGGVAACNSYGGSYVADAEDVIIGDELASTAMGCVEPGVMESEQAFLSALRAPLTYRRTGQTLTLTGEDVSMEFVEATPVPTAELVGTEWSLETLVIGEAAQTVAGDAFLELAEDGSVSGSTGCRTFSGEYVVDADTVLFTTFGMAGDCPADLADQDALIVGVLGDGFTVAVEGDHLTVTSRGGQGLIYRGAG